MSDELYYDGTKSKYGIMFFQWLTIQNNYTSGARLNIPPSVAIVELYTSLEKSLVNSSITGAIDSEQKFITRDEEQLLLDNNINYLKLIPGYGLLINTQLTMTQARLVQRRAIIRIRTEVKLALFSIVFQSSTQVELKTRLDSQIRDIVSAYGATSGIKLTDLSINTLEELNSILVQIKILVDDLIETIEIEVGSYSY